MANEAKEKRKTMTFGEKIDYIWTYYKAHIIIAVLAAALAVSLIHHLVTGNKESILYSMVINGNAVQADEDTPALYAYFMEEKGFDAKECKVDFHSGFYITLDEYGEASDLQIFSVVATLLMSGTVDHIMTDEDVAVMLGEIGYIMPVEEYLPAEKLAEYDKEGKVIYGRRPDTQEKTAFGISLAESEKMQESGLFQAPPVFSMVRAAPHQENSVEFLYFLEP